MKKIPLTQGLFALVDDEDFDYLSQWKWHAVKIGNTFYACSTTPRPEHKRIWMHRLICGVNDKSLVDHKNENGLDNQKKNLRRASKQQNAMNRTKPQRNNRSGHTGVYFHKVKQKWYVQLVLNGKNINRGYFESKRAAIQIRRELEKEYFGEFAPQHS